MNGQDAINISGALVNVIIDAAGAVPGLGIPIGALKVIKDGIAIEQEISSLLRSPQAAPVRAAIDRFAVDHGLSVHVGTTKIRMESIDEVRSDMARGVF